MRVLSVVVLVLSAGSILLAAVVAARRVHLARRELRWQRAGQRLRPQALAFLSAGTELPAGLSRADQGVLADVLGGYAQLLRGPARDRMAGYFERQGVTSRELRQLATARRGWRRAAAAHRLGDVGSPAVAGALIRALADRSRDVRTAAARSLGRLGSPEAADSLLAALAAGRVPGLLARWSLLQLGTAGLPRLRELTASSEPGERAGAIQLVGLLGGPSDAALLAGGLRDTSALVREQAAAALGRLGGSGSVPALLAALGDRIPAVRAAAADALARLRDPGTAIPLLEHARADTFDVARAAARALAAVDPGLAAREAEASPALAEAVDLARLR